MLPQINPDALVGPATFPSISSEENPTHNREMRVMGTSGDEKLTWDSDDAGQVQRARVSFNDYVNKGYRMYKTSEIGGKKTGDPISEFDPNVERMIAVPPVKGG